MIGSGEHLARMVADLRRDFDRSFAHAPTSRAVLGEAFLSVRIGGDAYGLRRGEIRGLALVRGITKIPGSAVELLGLAGVRGAVVPVYSLPALLGYPSARGLPWMVLVGQGEWIGLAFDRFEAQLLADARDIAPATSGERSRPWLSEAVRTGSGLLPVVGIPAVVAEIVKQTREEAPRRGAQGTE